MKVAVAAAVLASALLLGSCNRAQNTAPGAVSFSRITGNLNATLDAPLDRTWAATQAAVDELQFHTGTKSKDALTGIMTAKTADNSEVRIRLEKRTDSRTGITVGVGPFGKESLAQTVLDKIRAKI
jgi:hypothetical protein